MSPTEIKLIAAILGCNMDTGPWIAGSAAAWVCDVPFLPNRNPPGDVDVFFHDLAQLDTARATLEKAGATWRESVGAGDSEEGAAEGDLVEIDPRLHGHAYVYTLHGIKINLAAIAFWPDALTLIGGFDFTVCQFVTDGTRDAFTAMAPIDYNLKRLSFVRETRTDRVIKYIAKGYRIPGGTPPTWEDQPGRFRSDFRLRDAVLASLPGVRS